jgi:predicted GH43/DUF377 family glycosyl hydrolase
MSAKRIAALMVVAVLGTGMAMGQTVWVEDPENPAIGPGDTGSWDVGGPWARSVVFDGTTYHLYFTGSDSGGFPNDMGHATSDDGEEWTMDPANPVLTRGETGSWEATRLDGAAVIHDGTTFHMWYSAMDSGYVERVGYATSADGTMWTKHAGNPIVDVGPSGSWDRHYIRPTTVMVENGTYKMWYGGGHSTGTENWYAVGLAVSDNGLDWQKRPEPVLSPSTFPGAWDPGMVANPYIVFRDSTYHMWYSGGVESGIVDIGIGYAWSDDGINWTKHRGPVVPSGEAIYWHSPVLHDGTNWHMWYTSSTDLSSAQIEHATSTEGPGVPAFDSWRFIPAAALASGAEGAFFQTDVDVSNADEQAADYQFMWFPRDEDNSEHTTSQTFNLDSGKSARYTNVLSEVFELEPNSLGALGIKSTTPEILAMSRTYNTPIEETGGTFGQSMAAIPTDAFIQDGEPRRILFGSEGAEMRTNIGCQNGTDRTTVVYLDLYDDRGTSLGREMLILKPLGNEQINRIFDGHNPVNGYVDVSVVQAARFVYCYGSVLDNTTSDPTTIPPQ